MYCGSCGSPVPENTRFCASCGAPIDQAATPSKASAATTTTVATTGSSTAGSDIVARGHGGSYEQVLGVSPDAWWMCPPIAVSSRHIAFTIGSDLHLFEWQAQ